jgi:hypothetical protein
VLQVVESDRGLAEAARRKLQRDAVAGKGAAAVLAHASGGEGGHQLAAVEQDPAGSREQCLRRMRDGFTGAWTEPWTVAPARVGRARAVRRGPPNADRRKNGISYSQWARAA